MGKKIQIVLSIVIWLFSDAASAQVIDTTFAKKYVNYSNYIHSVGLHNLEYSAQKFNVQIAEANILTASVFPDPELSFEWYDNGQRRMRMGYGFGSELNWTLELGGKRKARVDLAKNESKLVSYLLEDFFRHLRADATISFLEAMQNKLLLQVQANSYLQMRKLAESDSIRFVLGAINQVDARQSKLEAGTLLNEVFSAEAEWKTSLSNLSLFLGQQYSDSLWYPIGDFQGFERVFSLSDLIIEAQNNRTDLQAALQNKNVSQSILKLTKAERTIDLGVSVGAGYDAYVNNIIAPTPSVASVRGGITIPLKFSNNRSGDLHAAFLGVEQADREYKQTEIIIQQEVAQAYFAYQASLKQVQQFNTGLLSESKAILDGKIYSYERGETSLLEVLHAQRTYNEMQQNYFQIIFSQASTLVDLERVVGMWDINF